MLPQELTTRRQWSRWILGGEDGTQKIPVTATGGTFRSNDPATFAEYEDVESHDLIAFVITEDDPYTGVDLDNCLDDKGKLREWAIPIVSRLVNCSYAEISPSGNGIKFITRAVKPEGSRCQCKIGEDKQQIEVYEKARFWTITRDVYFDATGIGSGQQAIDWICENYLGAKTTTAEAGNLSDFEPGRWSPNSMSCLPLAERMRRYMEAADRPTSMRNNAAFRLAGHLLSMEEDGFRSPPSFVLDLMRRWNALLPEALPDREIEKVVDSATKNGTAPAAKPSTVSLRREEPSVEPVDLMPTGRPVEPPSASTMYPPGILSDIIEYTLRTSLYPQPELALAGSITLMATITGRKLTDQFNTRTNLYIVGLAPSGAGKEQARKTNKALIAAASNSACDPQVLDYLGNERIGSHAGLLVAVNHRPSILFQLDEIGRMLSTMKSASGAPHLFNIATVLTQIYSASDCMFKADAYADSKKNIVIDQPHVCVYGTTVPDYFWGAITRSSVMDGLLGRIMPFEAAGNGYVNAQIPEVIDPPANVIDAINWWHKFQPQVGNTSDLASRPLCVDHAPEARDRYFGHMTDIAARLPKDEPGVAEMWSRAAGRAGKLALIFAASRQPATADFLVELEDVNRAIELSNFLTRRVVHQIVERVVENDTEDQVKKLLRLITRPMTKSEITQRSRWLQRRRRDEILADLIESDELAYQTEEVGKTIRTTYYRTNRGVKNPHQGGHVDIDYEGTNRSPNTPEK